MPRRKRKEYAVALGDDGRVSTERGAVETFGEAWSPEHLVLAALARCVLTSLRHHAGREDLEAGGGADATGAIFERADGSWGFAEIECRVDATVEPAPERDRLAELLARAERGCFVGASLEPRPQYSWRVNGADVGPSTATPARSTRRETVT